MSAQPQAELPDGTSANGTQPGAFGVLGDERRRGLWSFLTWAFVLAEAFRGAEARCRAVGSRRCAVGDAAPLERCNKAGSPGRR